MASMGPEERERISRRGGIEPEREKTIKVVAGGSVTEAVAGAATVVLAIIGLSGTLPRDLASVATIAFGVALIAQGGAIAARFRDLVRETEGWELDPRTEIGGGMGAEFVAGVAGIVLGILALIGVAPTVLLPISVIVFGGALLLSSGTTVDLSTLARPTTAERLTQQATKAASGTQVLVGVGAIVLGIIALVGVDPLTVTLVALLVLGAAVLLSGSAVSSRLLSAMRR